MKKALIIDDEHGVRLMLDEVLSKTHECSLVCNGREGFQLATHHRGYDIIFMDINMPEWDGLDALGMVQTLNPEARIVVLTGHLTSEVKHELQGFGCVRRIMHKPATVADLLCVVAEVEILEVGSGTTST